jgi:hypothetical protein
MNTSNIELKRGRNKWIIAEKIIGLVLLLWSVFILYNMLSVIAGMFSSGFVASGKATYGSIVSKYHFPIIVGILCLFGSCMLLYKDRTGWLLCVVTSLAYAIVMFISSRAKAIDSKLPFAKYYKSYGIVALLFFIIFFLLLAKPIRARYQPTVKTWLLIGGIVLLLAVDMMIF